MREVSVPDLSTAIRFVVVVVVAAGVEDGLGARCRREWCFPLHSRQVYDELHSDAL